MVIILTMLPNICAGLDCVFNSMDYPNLAVNSVCVGNDGCEVVSGCEDGTVKVRRRGPVFFSSIVLTFILFALLVYYLILGA